MGASASESADHASNLIDLFTEVKVEGAAHGVSGAGESQEDADASELLIYFSEGVLFGLFRLVSRLRELEEGVNTGVIESSAEGRSQGLREPPGRVHEGVDDLFPFDEGLQGC